MHCKDVSVSEVDVPLTKENIDSLMSDWTAYRRAEYIVLKHGDEYATVHVSKPDSPDLFIRVKKHEILSLPGDTIFLEIPELDIINQPALARLQTLHPGKTVVVRGNFSHVVFFRDLDIRKLKVVDFAPPYPAKLSVLVKRSLDSGYVDIPIITEENILRTEEKIPSVRTDAVMFPCKVSGLEAKGKNVYFLDGNPDVKEDVTLIGCHLSLSIFESLYGKKPKEFINICPADYVSPEEKTIVRCCRIREGHKKEGNVVKVPWGVTVPEISDAINDLFQ